MPKNIESSEVVLPRVKISHHGYYNAVIDIEEMLPEKQHEKTPKKYVQIARKAFSSNKTKPVRFREKQLRGLLKFFEERAGEIEEALYKDLGKHRQESVMCEIDLVANDLRNTLFNLESWASPEKPPKRAVNVFDGVYVYKDPYGVVLIIGAWNYPILLTCGPLVGALAAGNCVILKPPELATHTSNLLANSLTKYLDESAFQVLLGGAEETTELLKEKFDYIFFTGSSQVGKIVHQAAAKNLTPTTLELGGKCPVFLDDSANIQMATKRILWGRCLNSGQSCIGTDYLLCTKEVEEKFLVEAAKVLKEFYGDNMLSSKYLSKIVNVKHYNRLIKFIKESNVALGGSYDEVKKIVTPTILTNVKPTDSAMQEEIFGPILPILNVSSPIEALKFINEREKPLALYVFSKNEAIQKLFLQNTSSGSLCINDTIMQISVENLPFGGVGNSGMGAYHGKYGFDTFTHKKSVLVRNFCPVTEFMQSIRYPPYSDAKVKLMCVIMKRRRVVSLKYFYYFVIFCLGIGFTYLFQYIFNNFV